MQKTKADILYSKIIDRLNSDIIESDSEYISVYDLKEMCLEEMNSYNNYFKENTNNKQKSINFKYKLSGLFNDKNLYIHQIIPEIDEYNESMVDIVLENDRKKYCGELYILNDGYRLENFNEIRFKNKQNVDLINTCKNSFDEFLRVLDHIKEKYPNVSIKWDPKDDSKSSVCVEDDFFICKLNLCDPERTHLSLKSMDDIAVATSKTKKYGVLYDYIEFYNQALQKRLGVKVEELPEVFRIIVEKNNKKTKSLNKTLKSN